MYIKGVNSFKQVNLTLQDRQGIVKKIYRGILFIYDENETENGSYFCSKSQHCEKTKVEACEGKVCSLNNYPGSLV